MLETINAAGSLSQERVTEICDKLQRTEEDVWNVFMETRKELERARRYPPATVTLTMNTQVSRALEIDFNETKALHLFLKHRYGQK